MKPVKAISKMSSGEPLKITAFGDSLTYGWMVSKGYLDYLGELISSTYPESRVEILNRGVPGDTALDGFSRMKRDVKGDRADLVLVQFGLNDAYTGFSPDEFESNLERIITELKSSFNPEIALLTSVYIKMPEYRHVLHYYDRILMLAERYSLPVARVHKYWEGKVAGGADFYKLVQGDGVHPTEEGYKLFAEAVMDIFRPAVSSGE
ncbi:MAG TPA: SGNH/GDSL hydrolase family protein [Spirochaetota bacterium]|nr:SGNH/GDSL hydrolase family protein [Spirochaetota bacterium]